MARCVLNKVVILLMLTGSVYAQTSDTVRISESIAVAARPSNDSITLRWAPVKFSVWAEANSVGYMIERYVIARSGKVLALPEKSLLTATPLKPLEESRWEPLVLRNKYAAIAAQALYGERFEVDLSKADAFSIVNKVRENEQRFAFALFCADLSPAVAKASGLWFTDRNVKKGEKYLYRIILNSPEQTLKGSVFVCPDDPYDLPKPRNLKVEFKGQYASLRWERGIRGKYTAYFVERSDDGKSFHPISDEPLVTISPDAAEDTRYEYATDSIPDLSKMYYYRVRGVNPFGEMSAPSDVVSGKGSVAVNEVPYIRDGENVENKFIRITWEFPEEYNTVIKGFQVEHSSNPAERYTLLTGQNPLPPAARTYQDKSPRHVNYYRVTAIGLNGEQYRSPVYLAQLIDSIPPVAPTGLKATVDDYGMVEITWEPNKEEDIYGYRVYKCNDEKEEPSQITSEPVFRTTYSDNVNLNTLNEAVYYSVMAIDRNQNHSALSALLKVALPDKVRPQPPVFLPVQSGEKGVSLAWIKSSSADVVRYDVYRRNGDRTEWRRLKSIPVVQDSTYQYLDEHAMAGITNHYTVVAVDDAGLESEPATPVSGGKIDVGLRAAVQWREPVIMKDQKQVLLTWKYDLSGIKTFRIYKADGEGPITLYRSIEGQQREFRDVLVSGKRYQYRILAIFDNGSKSVLSDELWVKF